MRFNTFILSLVFYLPLLLGAQTGRFPEPIKKGFPVHDYAKVLSPNEVNTLTQKLLSYGDTTSTQIVVVIIKELHGEDPNLYAAELGQTWEVGQKGKENGLVILIAVKDRKMAIQNGYGLEDKLTDLETKIIIDEYITPAFKKGNYYQGIDRGTDQIFKVLNGSFEGSGNKGGKQKINKFIPFLLILVFFIIFFTRGNKGGRGGGYRGGGGYWIGGFGGGGFGGGSSGGFGGGGFSGGFGGGSFGGGGASGSW